MTQPRPSSRASLLTAMLLFLPAGLLANEIGYQHLKLHTAPGLTIKQVVNAAVIRAPEQQLSQALNQAAADQKHLSRRWISGVPRINISYRDDRTFDDTGLMETEAGLEFDLWRWNQQDNAKNLARSQLHKAESWQRYIRWRMSSQVRESLAQMATADALVHHAQQNINEMQRLLQISQKRYHAGNLPQSSILRSESLLLKARQQLQGAFAKQVDSQRRYTMLTGLDQRPASFVEQPPSIDQIDISHPQLQYLLVERQLQLAKQQQQRQQARGNTTVNIGIRREQAAYSEPEINSLGIAVSVPFGSRSVSRASSAEATIAVAGVDVELQQARRELQQQLHEVEHELTLQQQSLFLAKQSAELTQRQWQMAVKAFEAGESDLQPVILAQQQYQQSQLYLQLQQLRQQALQASFRQVVGELP